MTDTEFINQARFNLPETLIEQFCERVAICVADGISEDVAREIALAGVDNVIR